MEFGCAENLHPNNVCVDTVQCHQIALHVKLPYNGFGRMEMVDMHSNDCITGVCMCE